MFRARQAKAGWPMAVAAAAAIFFAPAARASIITYDFTVTITSGPLTGTDSGSFSYNSSSIVPGGFKTGPSLLTALNFMLNGIAYNASTANTASNGELSFDSSGNLSGAIFGTPILGGGVVGTTTGTNSWFVDGAFFSYATLAFDDEAPDGTVTYALAASAVPEPSAFALLGTALAGLFLFKFRANRRGRQLRPHQPETA
jgi:PEP-CTERM motif